MAQVSARPKTQEEWKQALSALPDSNKIPSFFFAHGSPMLAISDGVRASMAAMMKSHGPNGTLATFLKDFGPFLVNKYKPKGIVVFSAHWETHGERQVTDYGDENPLLFDYYGFQPEMYKLEFHSRGDSALSQRVVQLFKEAGMPARTTPKTEARGEDGRGFAGPGFDHGVFIPFRLMFGEDFKDIPIVQASIDSSLSPEKNWAVGKAVQQLREEGILVLSGGLTVHNLRETSSFVETAASTACKEFSSAITDAVAITDPAERKQAMFDLTKHKGFRAAHPREDHFVPLYVAAGAGGDDGEVRILETMYGAHSFAFGV